MANDKSDMKVILTRYTPFFLESQNKNDDILSKFSSSEWNLNLRKYHMDQLERIKLNIRNFPLCIDDKPPKSSAIYIETKDSDEPIKINFLATILFDFIFASREISVKTVDEHLLSGFLTAIDSFLKELGRDQIQIEPGLFIGCLSAVHSVTRDIAPTVFEALRNKFTQVNVPDPLDIIKDIDINTSQTVYIYNSKIGFILNQIYIDGLDYVDPEIIYSLDFLFRIASSWFKWKKDNIPQLIELINRRIPSVHFNSLKFIADNYYTITFNENVNISEINTYSLLNFPLIQVLGTNLKSNLILYKNKHPNVLVNQADFRSILKPEYSLYGIYPGEKIPIQEIMNFLLLQIFHEKVQLKVILEIYKELWDNWQITLTKALKWKGIQVLFSRKLKNLSQLSYEENTIEFYFRQRYANLNFDVRIDELSKTINFHLLFIPTREYKFPSPSTLEPLFPFNIDIPIEVLNDVATYLEFIDINQFIRKIAEELQIEPYYKAILDLHKSFEKMLDSVQELHQTKQQRLITISLVIFSLIQLLVAFLSLI